MNKNTIVYPSDTVVQLPCRTFTENPMDDDSRDSFTREIDALDVNVGSEEHSKNEASASEQSDLSYSTDDDSSNEEFVPVGKEKSVQKFDQKQLNDLLRSSGQSKEQAEFIASELKKRNILEKGTKITFYRNREESFRKYFHKDSDLLYCTDVKGLINELKPNLYKPEEWRLFIDSSMRSLKAVLLHNTNKYAPVPLGHSTVLKEDYSNLEMVLRKIKYAEHQWQICGDLKILSMILGQQSGFTKYPCYLCMFDSRDRASHYKKKIWGPRSSFEPGSSNIVREPLVDPSKILIPPLHIKLGLMKQFVKALDKEGNSFSYLSRKFNHKTDAKLMEGIFDGPEIRMLFRDENFVDAMTDAERAAWLSFKDVSTKFLGNTKDPNYRDIVAEIVQNYQNLGCLMNLKLHFLDSHVDEFPANNGDFSEEHGERFHQDLKEFERRFQGRWDVNMFADYCWMMKREVKKKSGKKRRRNPLHRSFEDKRVRKRKPI